MQVDPTVVRLHLAETFVIARETNDWVDVELVTLHDEIPLTRRRAAVACIALNTRHLDDAAARTAISVTEAETGLVTDDPVRFGAARLLDALLTRIGPLRQE